MIGAVCLLSACGRDALVDADAARARPPGAPSALVNPVCAGGAFQGPHTISTAVTWQASANPHLIDGT
ncbi:MAG TPA: hypothetical protein VFR37_25865, partial [Longimicrobium sp.]|nr:hypothetical protein [Longimicrobium sp.]